MLDKPGLGHAARRRARRSQPLRGRRPRERQDLEAITIRAVAQWNLPGSLPWPIACTAFRGWTGRRGLDGRHRGRHALGEPQQPAIALRVREPGQEAQDAERRREAGPRAPRRSGHVRDGRREARPQLSGERGLEARRGRPSSARGRGAAAVLRQRLRTADRRARRARRARRQRAQLRDGRAQHGARRVDRLPNTSLHVPTRRLHEFAGDVDAGAYSSARSQPRVCRPARTPALSRSAKAPAAPSKAARRPGASSRPAHRRPPGAEQPVDRRPRRCPGCRRRGADDGRPRQNASTTMRGRPSERDGRSSAVAPSIARRPRAWSGAPSSARGRGSRRPGRRGTSRIVPRPTSRRLASGTRVRLEAPGVGEHLDRLVPLQHADEERDRSAGSGRAAARGRCRGP